MALKTVELTELLFSYDGSIPYAVLDGASVDGLLDQLYSLDAEFECLYRGELEPDIAEVAPYLVRLQTGDAFTGWLLPRMLGKPWGVLALTAATLPELRTHFRRFLIVRDPEGKPMYFRYYDPRVLEIYLPTCNSEELTTVFGPVERYLVCNDPNKITGFYLSGGKLQLNETRTG